MEANKDAMAPKKQQTVIMYPSFGVGHIIPMTELAKVLLRHGLDVTMVLIERPSWSSDSGAAATRRVMAANPGITFHFLPPEEGDLAAGSTTKPPFFHTLQLLRRSCSSTPRRTTCAAPWSTSSPLERSGHRFLWVVRTPASTNNPRKFLEQQRPEPDLEALLPAGFLERTEGRGLVVTSWAPQVDVLRHPSTGAFVTHCRWNSVLEAIMAGMPMLCWPLYSEQMLNKVLMTTTDDGKGLGIAVELEGYAAGLIAAGEVKAKVRLGDGL
ncbi:hypothetical protein HU200_064075 [Digitaria exilis]|uniref:Uncharacterized protein n=1 Tax=Digitaria exilis TaxID=1010633 RepID=A0A835ACC3_9POAL|nr:hypothetical protein HU200_064075 [Digitaria exilis]